MQATDKVRLMSGDRNFEWSGTLAEFMEMNPDFESVVDAMSSALDLGESFTLGGGADETFIVERN